jgi:hypothetical protein
MHRLMQRLGLCSISKKKSDGASNSLSPRPEMRLHGKTMAISPSLGEWQAAWAEGQGNDFVDLFSLPGAIAAACGRVEFGTKGSEHAVQAFGHV